MFVAGGIEYGISYVKIYYASDDSYAVIAVYEVKRAVGVKHQFFSSYRFYGCPVVAYESREAYHGRIDSPGGP